MTEIGKSPCVAYVVVGDRTKMPQYLVSQIFSTLQTIKIWNGSRNSSFCPGTLGFSSPLRENSGFAVYASVGPPVSVFIHLRGPATMEALGAGLHH